MRRTTLKRNTPIKSSTLIKKTGKVESTTKGSKSSNRGKNGRIKTSSSTLQKKCDALLTPIIKKLFPKCLLCGKPTEVAHHHVHKSKSLILRYDLDNLINLCNSCHFALHQNESYYASRIVQIKGLPWFEGLQKKKDQITRTSPVWYEEKLDWLKSLL